MNKKLQNFTSFISCLMLCLVSFGALAQEQVLLGWQFYNTQTQVATVGTEITIASTQTHSGLNSSSISRGAAFKPYAQARSFGSQPYAPILDSIGAVQQGAFYQFNFKPTGTHKYLLSKLNFKIRLTGTWGSTLADKNLYCRWQYSLDGGQNFNNVGNKFFFSAATNTEGQLQTPIDLSNESSLQNIDSNTEIIFRLYSWGFSNGVSGAYAIGKTPSGTNDYSMSLTGTALSLSTITSEVSEAYFTETQAIAKGETSNVIIDKLVSMINNTPAGESIHVSIYMINHQSVMDALKAAETRGVNLHLIIDMSRSDSQETNATSLPWLQTNLPNSEVIVSVNDVSVNAINHHKFALFTKVQTPDGVLQKVTFQTSHNFTTSDARKIQDALVFNNADIYQAFLNNWQLIKANASSGMKLNFNYNTTNVPAINTQLAFFPRITGGVHDGVDNILNSLNLITDVANAKVRIAMSDWDNSRQGIVDKLIALHNQGATIEVYAKDAAGTQTTVKLKQLAQLGATVRIFNLEKGSDAKFNIHAKMMLIEGTYNGQTNSKVIITGSHNYTDGALKTNNEVLVTLVNSALFTQYSAYFNELKTVVPTVKIVAFDLSAITGVAGEEFPTYSSTYAAGLFPSVISRGSGLVLSRLAKGFSSSKAVLEDPDARTTSIQEAITRNEYFELAIQVKPGKKISISNLSAIIRRTGGGSSKAQWAYVINGANPVLLGDGVIDVPVYTSGGAIDEINVSGVAELQNLVTSSNVKLRLYMFGETSRGGTFAFGQSSTAAPEVLVLRGDLENVADDKVVLGWSAGDLSGETATFTSTANATSVTTSTISRGSGLEASSLTDGYSSRTNASLNFADITNQTSAVANNSYLEFAINIKANYKLSLDKIYAKLRRSGAGARNYVWSYSIDNAAFVDINATPVSFTNSATSGIQQEAIDLSAVAALQNIQGAKEIKFRLYMWGYTTAAGSFALGLSETNSEDVLTIIGTSVNTLPVSLTNFEAVKNNNSVNLTWETASEQNNSHFDVLKSVDGKNWQLLTSVLGGANSNKVMKYSSKDNRPAFGINYYQLKQVDFDGTSSLSKIEAVNFSISNEESLKVNYANNTLKLFINKTLAERAEIAIYSVDGRKISAKKTYVNNGAAVITLPITLAKGIYLVKVKSANNVLTQKFITN
ncbi:phospholipase D-like domain-containing protein [uncultured Pedobacter sp.]|uniref:phospholipase D-like domain-containing protein n=1 Tax=uncultured Pedobacter sp. TaxID=246139 RepID=UPI002609A348|nr:phospholipase D-like domain-containing protein [uncultured Pedobacter sp.]